MSYIITIPYYRINNTKKYHFYHRNGNCPCSCFNNNFHFISNPT
ncbi:hypothetical protein M6B38_209030 [Iris pallida]|uniref:Uncharacterized protein n=1 Tax=Iris pallida TaxID=29817 RepID=A0AAX6E4Y9_IRIPA|nr:hypothetical protein M6B38_209030 [Iris pallida]